MPTYQYQAKTHEQSCDHCKDGFDIIQRIADPKLITCPHCGNPIARVIAAPALGRSQSNLHDRAKAAGFHTLKKVDHGTFEKMY